MWGHSSPIHYGISDTVGNAWEWVQDGWIDNYETTPLDGLPSLSGDCEKRVTREGGSFGSAYRSWAIKNERRPTQGLRLVREF